MLFPCAGLGLVFTQGVLNYVIIRPVCTFLALITGYFHAYGENVPFSAHKANVYLAAANSLSQVMFGRC